MPSNPPTRSSSSPNRPSTPSGLMQLTGTSATLTAPPNLFVSFNVSRGVGSSGNVTGTPSVGHASAGTPNAGTQSQATTVQSPLPLQHARTPSPFNNSSSPSRIVGTATTQTTHFKVLDKIYSTEKQMETYQKEAQEEIMQQLRDVVNTMHMDEWKYCKPNAFFGDKKTQHRGLI